MQPLGALAVVKAVAEADDDRRIVLGDHRSELRQCRRRIVGRDQHAAAGEGRTLFQMQVGDHQQPRRGEEQRAAAIDVVAISPAMATAGRSPQCALPAPSFVPIASSISVSAASRSNVSLASPSTNSLPISSMTGTASGEMLLKVAYA